MARGNGFDGPIYNGGINIAVATLTLRELAVAIERGEMKRAREALDNAVRDSSRAQHEVALARASRAVRDPGFPA